MIGLRQCREHYFPIGDCASEVVSRFDADDNVVLLVQSHLELVFEAAMI